MALGKRLINTGGVAACTTDSVDPFGDSSGVALYSLDYDASTAPDGTDYSGTPTNVDFGVGGAIGAYGARFNGSSSVIKLTSGDGINVANANSLSLWFYVNDSVTSFDKLYSNIVLGGELVGQMNIVVNNGVRIYGIRTNGSTSTTNLQYTATLSLNTWHHLVVVMQGGSDTPSAVYIDDTPLTASPQANTAITSQYAYPYIGGASNSAKTNYFNGKIDQVRIFNKALNSTEVSTLYAETACVYTCTTDTVDYPTTNLAYYKLDSAEDETGSYDGTATNVSYTFGRFGQAAVFNGSSSKLIASGFAQPTGDASLSMWIKFNSIPSAQKEFLDWVGNSSVPTIRINTYDSNDLRFASGNGERYISADSLSVTTGVWYHIAASFDRSANAATCYFNGQALGSTISITGSSSNTEGLFIGCNDNESRFSDCVIDQVRIFSSALTSDQVTELYNEKPCADTSNFKTVLYEGTGATQYISNVGFEPDLVWLKCRNVAKDHRIYDSVRGATKFLEANNTDAEATASTSLTSFDSNGFTLGAASTTNSNNDTFIAWNWKAGGLAVSNTDGTDITSQVSANTGAGFSIVKWTGTGDDTDTIGHGLDPNGESMIVIMKDLDSSSDWMVITNNLWSTPTTSYLKLNTTQAVTTGSGTPYLVNNTVFKNTNRNISGNEHIAYCFHSVAGYSKIGTYTSTGVSGQEITGLGFAPSFVMIKNAGDVGSWIIHDKARNPNNPSTKHLRANSNSTEDTGANEQIDFDSDGFTLNGTGQNINHSDLDTYIYLAFA